MPISLRKLIDAVRRLAVIDRSLDQVKINQGLILSELNSNKKYDKLSDYEFTVFSQWGEDGIIQHLTKNIEIKNRSFIEFGVEDFFESNCRLLLQKDLWSGFVIDGSRKNIDRLKSSYFYWKYPLEALCSFISQENVRELLSYSGFDKDVGILSVDIDGVDYFVLEQLADWKPRILIVEYNAVFGSERAVSVPYDAGFVRSVKHVSNLYYGASLPAFVHLVSARGMALVGVNSVSSNAFFVRRELLNERIQEKTIQDCFRESCFREGRDDSGKLSFLSGGKRKIPIAHLPLIDVVSGESLQVMDL